MSLTLITPPAARPLELDAAKVHLAVEHADHDDMIDQLIDAAIGHLDGADGWLQHALEVQTWELRLDRFPQCIELPLPPLVRVDSIDYLDRDGTLRTLEADQYQVEPGGGVKRALIAPAQGVAWPATQCDLGAVRVTFTAGYPRETADSPPVALAGVPAPLVTALKLQVEIYYGRNPDNAKLLQDTADNLAGKYRSFA